MLRNQDGQLPHWPATTFFHGICVNYRDTKADTERENRQPKLRKESSTKEKACYKLFLPVEGLALALFGLLAKVERGREDGKKKKKKKIYW